MRLVFAAFLLVATVWAAQGGATPGDFHFLKEIVWDPSGLSHRWADRLSAYLWVPLILLGFWGWARSLRRLFLTQVPSPWATHASWGAASILFGFWLFGWGVWGLLQPATTAAFFLVGFLTAHPHWEELERPLTGLQSVSRGWWVALGIAALPYLFETLSAPIYWDTLSDHFRFAREVSRTGFLPAGWVNFNGNMPKAADLVLAGFWNLGGESLAKLGLFVPTVGCLALVGDWVKAGGGRRRIGILALLSTPFFLPFFTSGFAEGELLWFLALSFTLLIAEGDRPGPEALRASLFLLGGVLSVKYTGFFGAVGWAAVWFWRGLQPKGRFAWDGLWPVLVLLPVLGWWLRNFLAVGNPVFPILSGFFQLPPGYSPEGMATIMRETLGPESRQPLVLLKYLYRAFLTPQNGMLVALGPIAFLGWTWWKPARREAWIVPAIFLLAYVMAWSPMNTLLRHVALAALVLVAGSAWGLDRAWVQGKRGVRVALGLVWAFSVWTTFLTQAATGAPYASALGLESEEARLVSHYYNAPDDLAAYRFVEDHSKPSDRLLLFSTFLAYPIDRTAYFDFQWSNPILLQWAKEAGSAEGLARRLHREGVDWVVYHRGEAELLARGDRAYRADGLSMDQWVEFWGGWMEPAADLGNTLVYRLRTTGVQRPGGLSDLPGPLDLGLAHAHSAFLSNGHELGARRMQEWIGMEPRVASAWERLGQYLWDSGDRAQAVAAFHRAAQLGLARPDFLERMAALAAAAKDPAAKVWADRALKARVVQDSWLTRIGWRPEFNNRQ